METNTNLFDKKVGDRIEIRLYRYGEFYATLHKIEGNLFTFMFDFCIAKCNMDPENINMWFNSYVFRFFPGDIRKYIKEVRLATVGEIFGHNHEWCDKCIVMRDDGEEQLPLMKMEQYRISFFNVDRCSWWLRNALKNERELNKIGQQAKIAGELKAIMDSYIRAGFTKEQAFQLILAGRG